MPKNISINKLLTLLVLLNIGCSNTPKPFVIHISKINQERSVKITGLDVAVIQDIARDTSGANWQGLIPVYKMPADTEMKSYQPVQPGTYHIADGAVIFTPDTPFVSRQTYFVRYYQFDNGNKPADFIGGHNRPGSLHYVDLTF
ncbi:hypothetical protein [Mucilaginibacter sp. 22184]|uniref:hypothetical protein n=1 Tax=Mucilaginibacter sp. 22184 TaxID=3453887 RepID=UPI003F849432